VLNPKKSFLSCAWSVSTTPPPITLSSIWTSAPWRPSQSGTFQPQRFALCFSGSNVSRNLILPDDFSLRSATHFKLTRLSSSLRPPSSCYECRTLPFLVPWPHRDFFLFSFFRPSCDERVLIVATEGHALSPSKFLFLFVPLAHPFGDDLYFNVSGSPLPPQVSTSFLPFHSPPQADR